MKPQWPKLSNISRYHNLEKGQTKSGQLGDWLVKKKCYMHENKKAKKEPMLKFKMISRTCLIFMIAFMVYE